MQRRFSGNFYILDFPWLRCQEMGSLRGFFRLMRPVNSLMMGFAVIVGAFPASGVRIIVDSWLVLLLAFFTAFTLTGGAMAVNDYYDREIDAVNEPQRPIPSGAVSPNESLFFFIFLSILGLTISLLTNLKCFAIAVFAWILMTLYSTWGKQTGLLGNLLVSAPVSFPFIYGPLAVGGILPPSSFIFASMAFLSNTGREVTKGIVDVEGDQKKDVKTIAVSYGLNTAALLSLILNLIAVFISLIPWILRIVSPLYLPPIVVSDIGFIFSSILLLREPSREKAKRIKNLFLIWMVLALIGFLMGNLIN